MKRGPALRVAKRPNRSIGRTPAREKHGDARGCRDPRVAPDSSVALKPRPRTHPELPEQSYRIRLPESWLGESCRDCLEEENRPDQITRTPKPRRLGNGWCRRAF